MFSLLYIIIPHMALLHKEKRYHIINENLPSCLRQPVELLVDFPLVEQEAQRYKLDIRKASIALIDPR